MPARPRAARHVWKFSLDPLLEIQYYLRTSHGVGEFAGLRLQER